MTLVKVNCCFLFDEQYYIDSENFTVLFLCLSRLQHFKDCISFIHECRLNGGSCLVHWQVFTSSQLPTQNQNRSAVFFRYFHSQHDICPDGLWPVPFFYQLTVGSKVLNIQLLNEKNQISQMSFVFLQPCRCIKEHYHGGGLPDDCHPLQLGGVSVCCQSCSFLCWAKLWLPAAAAGVPDYTSLRGKHAKKQRRHECTHTVHYLQNASNSLLLLQCFRLKSNFKVLFLAVALWYTGILQKLLCSVICDTDPHTYMHTGYDTYTITQHRQSVVSLATVNLFNCCIPSFFFFLNCL